MWRLQGGYTIMAKDRYGCATRRSKSTCNNSHTIQRQRLERRVLSGLKDRMLAPDLVAEFMRAFAEETAALQRESAGASARLSRELADVERRLTGVLTAIENGAWSDSLQARLTELEHRKTALTCDIAEAAAPAPVVTLHPNAAELYRRRVAELETALAQPDIASEAAAALAALIHKVVLTPDPTAADGLAVNLHGDLALILRLASRGSGRTGASATRLAQNEKLPTAMAVAKAVGSQLTVVAGTGFEPVTFRL